jgi:histidine triad (HIT) family protein
MEDCIFCKIVRKEILAKIVYEDDRIIAFEDIQPQAPIHILLIPKEHFTSLNALSEDKENLIGSIFLSARRIAEERGIKDRGYRIVLNTGKESGQEVFHIHFHLLGGRRMTWPPG